MTDQNKSNKSKKIIFGLAVLLVFVITIVFIGSQNYKGDKDPGSAQLQLQKKSAPKTKPASIASIISKNAEAFKATEDKIALLIKIYQIAKDPSEVAKYIDSACNKQFTPDSDAAKKCIAILKAADVQLRLYYQAAEKPTAKTLMTNMLVDLTTPPEDVLSPSLVTDIPTINASLQALIKAVESGNKEEIVIAATKLAGDIYTLAENAGTLQKAMDYCVTQSKYENLCKLAVSIKNFYDTYTIEGKEDLAPALIDAACNKAFAENSAENLATCVDVATIALETYQNGSYTKDKTGFEAYVKDVMTALTSGENPVIKINENLTAVIQSFTALAEAMQNEVAGDEQDAAKAFAMEMAKLTLNIASEDLAATKSACLAQLENENEEQICEYLITGINLLNNYIATGESGELNKEAIVDTACELAIDKMNSEDKPAAKEKCKNTVNAIMEITAKYKTEYQTEKETNPDLTVKTYLTDNENATLIAFILDLSNSLASINLSAEELTLITNALKAFKDVENLEGFIKTSANLGKTLLSIADTEILTDKCEQVEDPEMCKTVVGLIAIYQDAEKSGDSSKQAIIDSSINLVCADDESETGVDENCVGALTDLTKLTQAEYELYKNSGYDKPQDYIDANSDKINEIILNVIKIAFKYEYITVEEAMKIIKGL
ncbi:MAG: hypothetical protein UR27_C0005G0031 [Candidatus Peregrinibacteria bacterium GW2011_GWA2_33_10]|nr:MAG: hypothetical protein UR27_C0005G0031 [Candidatus Peregrinibacteria bacterium GW2011_GWA2_33_10]KKP39289.1 MAG: hypothetical protein UR30_C0011G0032 [Candidatus Peregrinibacteria bacterium GW2011_GWC2_33_13]OGJ49507.1 MAG: hypothetical protein A2229_03705 [Candidatus Peregrinibacteria bacterium RIFOXYA2_FULL_33_7]